MTTSEPRTASATAGAEAAAAVSGLFGRDMIYLAFWALQIILAAALTPATTRLMGQTPFGQASAAVAVTQLLNCLFGFGLYTAVQRAYAGDGGEEHARHLVALAIVLSLLTGSITYATGRWWCPMIGLGPFPVQIRFAVLWAVATAITAPSLGLLRSQDRLRGFVAASFAQSIFAQALALGLVVLVAATAGEYMLGQFLGEVLTAIIALWIARPKLPSRAHVPVLAEALRFSTALVPASIASFVFDASDRIVIHGDLGPHELGRYAVARNIGGFAIVLLQLITFVWMPRLFRIKDREARLNVLGTTRDGLYRLAVTFAITLAFASPVVLLLWAPPSYQPHSLLLITALIAAGAVPAADQLIYTQVLILEGRTGVVAIAALLVAFLNLGLNLLLVPVLGIDGSAGITFCCYVIGAVRSRWLAGSAGPSTRARTLYGAAAGVAVCIASAAIPPTGLALVLRLLVAAGGAMAFLMQFAALVRPEIHDRLRRRVRTVAQRISRLPAR